jgi:O-methyltransferase involved in polyketide biosynthesis
MESEKVHLTNEKEPYLATLYGKALDYRTKNPILGDKFADEVVRRVDFDFEKLKLPEGAEITLPIRAKHLDQWTREFLEANGESTVLNLGCGLDSRVFRIGPPASVRWYDVDLPEVIGLRRRLYPERHDYVMIGSSVTKLGWLNGIPADRPVIVVAEGLLHYLEEKDVITLFRRITEKFPAGQIIFDAYSPLTIRLIMLIPLARTAGVYLRWGIKDPQEFEKQVPRLKLITVVPFLTLPEIVERLSQSWFRRMMFRLIYHSRFLKNSILHLRYQF